MTPRQRWRARAALAALALWPAAPPGRAAVQDPSPLMPTFRSRSDAVMVDASVRDRSRRVITNLTPADFEVYDNGVLQQVDAVSYGKLPIDITIGLDVSYSVTGTMLERLRRGVVQLMRDLGREDRLKLMLFNMQAARSVDFTTDETLVERAIKSATAGGGTSLLDTISVSLVSASRQDRRHLIVFFTDGRDSVSVTTPDTLATVAQRTRATLTFVLPAAPIVVTSRGAGSVTTSVTGMTLGVGRGQEIYASLAKETGGSVLPVSPLTDLTATFRGILEGFRSTYVLYYNATGVDRGGYHTLEVKVKREGAVVQARRGYLGG